METSETGRTRWCNVCQVERPLYRGTACKSCRIKLDKAAARKFRASRPVEALIHNARLAGRYEILATVKGKKNWKFFYEHMQAVTKIRAEIEPHVPVITCERADNAWHWTGALGETDSEGWEHEDLAEDEVKRRALTRLMQLATRERAY